MPLGGLVEGRADHLSIDRALHVGHLLGTLVNEEHDQDHFLMIGHDTVGDRLQEHGFAGPRGGDDQPALPLADRGEEIHYPGGVVVGIVLQVGLLARVEGCEVVEEDLVFGSLGVLKIEGLHLEERKVALCLLRRPNLPGNGITGAEVEPPNLRRRDIDVIGTRQVIVIRGAEKAESVR